MLSSQINQNQNSENTFFFRYFTKYSQEFPNETINKKTNISTTKNKIKQTNKILDFCSIPYLDLKQPKALTNFSAFTIQQTQMTKPKNRSLCPINLTYQLPISK